MFTVRLIHFYCLRLLRAAPVSFAICCVSFVAMLACACAYILEGHRLTASQNELAALRLRTPVKAAAMPAPASNAPNLPWFDSARLVEQLDAAAEEAKLPVDEVGYALEESAQHPYLRYRITLSVTASYPTVRQFVDDVSSSMPHVALDGISCTRADIALPAPTCELAFSAFFRKDAHAE